MSPLKIFVNEILTESFTVQNMFDQYQTSLGWAGNSGNYAKKSNQVAGHVDEGSGGRILKAACITTGMRFMDTQQYVLLTIL